MSARVTKIGLLAASLCMVLLTGCASDDAKTTVDAEPSTIADANADANVDHSRDPAEVIADNGQKGETVNVKLVSWKDLPFQTVQHQAYDYSCGSAAVATLLTYSYGIPTSEQAVFNEMFTHGDQDKIRREGFSMLDMSHYLNAQGLDAKGYKISEEAIARYSVPFIALINNNGYNHFVVVKNEANRRILIGDPNTGNTDYPIADFNKMWSGIALIVTNKVHKARTAYNDPQEWHFARPHALIRMGNDLSIEEASLSPMSWQIAPVGVDILPLASIGSSVSSPVSPGGL